MNFKDAANVKLTSHNRMLVQTIDSKACKNRFKIWIKQCPSGVQCELEWEYWAEDVTECVFCNWI